MPLLGRSKSLVGSLSSMSSSGAGDGHSSNEQSSMFVAQQLCESPLFGIRKQIVVQTTTATPVRSPRSALSHQNSLLNSEPSAPPQIQSRASTAELSSIPQQITRQQIHYAFSIMDTNQDGLIDPRDLSQMVSNLGVPIDEAILSYIMSSLSKRADRRVSESDFVDWISHFIEIKDSEPLNQSSSPSSRRRAANQRRLAGVSTLTAGAGPGEVSSGSSGGLRRRGSGSGLALMRSLSCSSSSIADLEGKSPSSSGSSESARTTIQQSAADLDADARNDLRAAFCVFDLDGDGYITLDEVRKGLKLLGESWSPSELRKLFTQCSTSGDSQNGQRISIDDFVALLL